VTAPALTPSTHREAGLARRAVVIVLALALLAGAAVWWFVLRDDAPPPAALGGCAVADDGEGPEAPEGTWRVRAGEGEPDAGFVGYRVDEQFGGETVTKTAVGRTSDVDGTMVVTREGVSEVAVVAHLASLRSDRTARDTALHTKGLETDTFPDARFTLTEPVDLTELPARGTPIDAVATGTLELHGEEHEVAVPIEACWTGPTIRLSGSTPIVFADYGMERIETPIVSTADHGVMELELVFEPG
jgi:polyisoprenoid-binding protein YceI